MKLNKLALAIVLTALTLTGCVSNPEGYTGAVRDKPCVEQYSEMAGIDRCEYDTSYNTN